MTTPTTDTGVNTTPAVDHFTAEDQGKVGSILTVEDARKAHHLASADPEVDGKMTGPAHEALYGLERADASAEVWRARGVHPTENRALQGDEDGGRPAGDVDVESVVNIADDSERATPDKAETATPAPSSTTAAPSAPAASTATKAS
jgi:hypothetical protein